MQSTVESIARQLGGASKSGDNWSCRCPAHDDKRASLSITEKQDGKLLVHCHAGCDQTMVVAELKAQGLWPSTAKPTPDALPPPPVQIGIGQGKGVVIAEYSYLDEDGQLLYQAVRYVPKDFRQRAWVDGKWVWSIKGVRRVLYRLPEVLAAVAEGRTVYICEGEKDVEAARSVGLVATCNAMGADNGTGNKWLPQFGQTFKGANVVVVPDQDDPGIRHAEWVISTLSPYAQSVKVVNPASGKDLADWIEAGATVADIEAEAIDAFECVASNDISLAVEKKSPLFVDVGELIDNLKPIDWLVEDYVEKDSLSLIFSPPSSGKSFVLVDIACCVATGTDWHGRPVQQGPVFYIAGEGHNGMARRFAAWQKHHGVSLKGAGIYKSQRAISIFSEDAARDLYEVVKEMSEAHGVLPALIIIDTVARNFGDGDENSTEDMGKFITHLDTFVRLPFGCNVFLAHHSGHNMDRARGSSALKAALDSEYQVAKEGPVLQLIPTKMKDAELPPELTFKLTMVDLGEIDGKPMNSAILAPQEDVLDFKIGTDSAGEGITAKTLLELVQRGWLPFAELKDALNCTKTTATRAVSKCVERELLKKDGAGYKLTDKATGALSLTGHMLLEKDKPVWKRGE
ncbi:Archaeal primase DnaG/twinkle, TOPRIM domain [uncultured Caudovirales phage]|uniref:Archaeal primase DnaG/twinkle, TOPRIM domain n=1 Tax=uncultured Caudovirales phage TaxID=2100421 RepID=A0A6J5LBR1_9CAUD|nr:Archaeal primase DnaG/twinkle, TOPRIM domain [uncultured Caudovirales phage]